MIWAIFPRVLSETGGHGLGTKKPPLRTPAAASRHAHHLFGFYLDGAECTMQEPNLQTKAQACSTTIIITPALNHQRCNFGKTLASRIM